MAAAVADERVIGQADEAVHAAAVDVLLAGERAVRAAGVVRAARFEERAHALADAVRHAHRRHPVLHREPRGVRVGAEEGVEGAVLLHDHDHVLDHVDAVRPLVRDWTPWHRRAVAATGQRGQREQEQRDSQLNGG